MGSWRTGSDRGDVPGPRQRTLYGPDGELRGVMFSSEDALLVIRALQNQEYCEKLKEEARLACKDISINEPRAALIRLGEILTKKDLSE